MTGLLVSLNYFANNRVYFLRNFYEKSKRSILKAKTEGPAAYVLPANDPRPGRAGGAAARAAEAARRDFARDGGVHGAGARARAAGRRGAAQARAGGAAAAGDAAAQATRQQVPRHATPPTPAARTEAASSRPAATSSAWTSRTRASPTRCSTTSTGRRTIRRPNPYDDTGWTFPEGFAVQAVRVIDTKVLDVPVTAGDRRVTPRRAVSRVPGTRLRDQSQRATTR